MGSNYLIDTNCLIDFGNGNLPISVKEYLSTIIDNRPCISIIDKIEILSFSNQSTSILELLDYVNVIGLINEIADITVGIRKLAKIKLPDATIASTALKNDLVLITRNLTDFRKIVGLQIANPWDK